MNRLMAQLFSYLISLTHIMAISGLAILTYYILTASRDKLAAIPMLGTLPQDATIPALIAVWCVYIMVAGLCSTIIAINDNLIRLNKNIGRIR